MAVAIVVMVARVIIDLITVSSLPSPSPLQAIHERKDFLKKEYKKKSKTTARKTQWEKEKKNLEERERKLKEKKRKREKLGEDNGWGCFGSDPSNR